MALAGGGVFIVFVFAGTIFSCGNIDQDNTTQVDAAAFHKAHMHTA